MLQKGDFLYVSYSEVGGLLQYASLTLQGETISASNDFKEGEGERQAKKCGVYPLGSKQIFEPFD